MGPALIPDSISWINACNAGLESELGRRLEQLSSDLRFVLTFRWSRTTDDAGCIVDCRRHQVLAMMCDGLTLAVFNGQPV